MIAQTDPYVIEMGVHHYDSIRTLKFEVPGGRLPHRNRFVGYAIDRDLCDHSVEGSMDLDMPAVPIFVGGSVRLEQTHNSSGRTNAA
jgi:hypothetical protein